MCWLDYTNLRRYVSDLRLIVVMPQCGRSFYINTVDGRRVEDFVADDLGTFIDSQYATLGTRASRAIGGISMGGYGALMLALRYRQIWGAAFSHSGALGAPRWVEDPPNVGVFGPLGSAVRHEHDLFHLIEYPAGPLPQIHMDCGIEDFLVDENRAFHRTLQNHTIPHIYREHPGGHSWRYCDENLPSSLDWVCRQLEGNCHPDLDDLTVIRAD
jgi:S-formylglutathione hydrolase FrmB